MYLSRFYGKVKMYLTHCNVQMKPQDGKRMILISQALKNIPHPPLNEICILFGLINSVINSMKELIS